MVKSNNKVFEEEKKLENSNNKKNIYICNIFLFFNSEKNILMYAGAPKIAQELFFWSYHLWVGSSYWRKYLAVEKHCYVQLYTSDSGRVDSPYTT